MVPAVNLDCPHPDEARGSNVLENFAQEETQAEVQGLSLGPHVYRVHAVLVVDGRPSVPLGEGREPTINQ